MTPHTASSGMAGSFGIRPEIYEASVQIANLSLLPKLAETTADTLIVTSGFSCREQIEGLTGSETLHLADVFARGIG